MGTDDEEPHKRKWTRRLKQKLTQKRPVVTWDVIGALCAMAQVGIEIGQMLAGYPL